MKVAVGDLRAKRLAGGLTLADVAENFSPPICSERVRQIETAARVQERTRARYELALARALRWLEEMEKIKARIAPALTVEIEKARQQVNQEFRES